MWVQGLELINEEGRYGCVTGHNWGPPGRVALERLNIHHIYKAAW
jgi:hypothetical protein